jgi:hypothetical protein
MSAIASLIVIPKAAVGGLREAAVPPKKGWLGSAKDTYWDYLKQNGREVADYPWSGYVLGSVMDWLQEKHQIDLMTSSEDELANFLSEARETTHFVLPVEHRHAYLERLDPSAFSAEDFRRYYNEFHETDEPDLGTSMEDGIGVLKQALLSVDQNSLVVVIIG